MSDGNRSFWSSVPGLVTGLAGLLTGIVGLVTVFIQLGVLGGKDSGKNTAATGTTVTSTTTGGSSTVFGGTGTTTPAFGAGTFTVSPSALDFQPSDPKEKTVTVTNTSSSGSLTVLSPTVIGPDKDRFSPSLDSCARPVTAGLSCTLRVTFTPSGALRRYGATLQVMANGASRGQEVALTATTLL